MGIRAFVQKLLAGNLSRTPASSLIAAQVLLHSNSKDPDISNGLLCLAEAFAWRGHLDTTAAFTRKVFAYWQDDAYESDLRRDYFTEKLDQAGGPALVRRFDMLIDGSDDKKTFVIGLRKTGTTSIQHALQYANVLCSPQYLHERTIKDWAERKFDRIVRLCRHYEAFQDYPFALPFIYQALDQAFPDSCFILSIRDTPDQWYESLVDYDRQVIFDDQPASWERIDSSHYGYPGLLADTSRLVYRWQDYGLYDRKRAIDFYQRHNDDVREYFYHRPDKVIVINIAGPTAYATFCSFLGLSGIGNGFDRANARSDADQRPTELI